MTDMEKIAEKLDKICPRWWIDWASQVDLQDMAWEPNRDHRAMMIHRLSGQFHYILNAAHDAGLVVIQ